MFLKKSCLVKPRKGKTKQLSHPQSNFFFKQKKKEKKKRKTKQLSHPQAERERAMYPPTAQEIKKWKIKKQFPPKNEAEILFSSLHFHFGPYFLILPYLIPKIKRWSHFGPYLRLTNGNSLRGKRCAPWVRPVWLATHLTHNPIDPFKNDLWPVLTRDPIDPT